MESKDKDVKKIFAYISWNNEKQYIQETYRKNGKIVFLMQDKVSYFSYQSKIKDNKKRHMLTRIISVLFPLNAVFLPLLAGQVVFFLIG